MKKRGLLLMMLVGISWNAMTQDIPSSVIDINNVRGMVLGTGCAFSNILGNELTWEVPKDSGKSPLFQYSLWVGGMDINNQIHLAANRYNQEGRDYWMGPLTVEGSSTYAMIEENYHHIWNLTRSQIEEFIANHGQPGYEIPQDILTWPAHGPEYYGYAPNLAPFVDVNNDGHYDPEDGDYPDILGDQCLFFIFNDSYATHTETGGKKLGMEVHAMVYAYNDPSDEFIHNTVFFHYDLINRSTVECAGTYVGVWNDWDIGDGEDDFVGCDVLHGTCYSYNGSANDAVYGDNAPAQLCIILAGPYKDPDGIDNPAYTADSIQLCDASLNGMNFGNGIVDDERLGLSRFLVQLNGDEALGDPINAEQTYRVLKGRWKDGSQVLYGGCGYPGMPGVVGPACRYMYPGESDPCNYGTDGVSPGEGYNYNGKYWTEVESGNTPGDRRGLAVAGHFTYYPGAVQPLDFALTTVWKTDTQSALDRIEAAVEAVRHKFGDDDPMIVGENTLNQENPLKAYPNPADGMVCVEGTGRLMVVNATGQQVLSRHVSGQTNITLPAGLYLIRLEHEKGCAVRKLVVK